MNRWVLKRWLGKPGDWRRSIKWGWQRARRGYSDGDWWSLDSHLSRVIVGGVGALRDSNFGHPCELTSGEWHDILAQIVEGFSVDEDTFYDSPENKAKFDKAFELLHEWYFGLWD